MYAFREVSWHKGLAITVDTTTRKITANADKTFDIFSLTKNSYDWHERKLYNI